MVLCGLGVQNELSGEIPTSSKGAFMEGYRQSGWFEGEEIGSGINFSFGVDKKDEFFSLRSWHEIRWIKFDCQGNFSLLPRLTTYLQ
jgi:hypothetical protein